jgi:hypothetical protein
MNTFEMFNEIDLATGLYHWLQDNWENKKDPLYLAFKALTTPGIYKPTVHERSFENINDDARYIYDLLTYDNYEMVLYKVTGFMPNEYACG